MKPLINSDIVALVEDVEDGCGSIVKRRFSKGYIFPETDNKLKVCGQPSPGARVEILWTLFDEPDIGYIFTLPGFDSDDIYMSGIVHIPKPHGCEKCDCEPEWIYINRLLSIEEVLEVRIGQDNNAIQQTA